MSRLCRVAYTTIANRTKDTKEMKTNVNMNSTFEMYEVKRFTKA